MTDEKCRRLEVQYRSCPSPENGAAWLAERARQGFPSMESIRLAAFLGHESACLMTGEVSGDVTDPDTWAADLARFGRTPCVELALFLGEDLMGTLTLPRVLDPVLFHALDAARRDLGRQEALVPPFEVFEDAWDLLLEAQDSGDVPLADAACAAMNCAGAVLSHEALGAANAVGRIVLELNQSRTPSWVRRQLREFADRKLETPRRP